MNESHHSPQKDLDTPDAARPVMVAGMPLSVFLDRCALSGIALGFILVFQPWGGTLRSGFFVTFVFTLMHVVTSHLDHPKTPEHEPDGSGARQ